MRWHHMSIVKANHCLVCDTRRRLGGLGGLGEWKDWVGVGYTNPLQFEGLVDGWAGEGRGSRSHHIIQITLMPLTF